MNESATGNRMLTVADDTMPSAPGDGLLKPGGTAPRYSRRLSDKILIAFHHACDQDDYEIAEQLLAILERLLTRRNMPSDTNRRKSIESLVAAHERLWHLRHPERKYG